MSCLVMTWSLQNYKSRIQKEVNPESPLEHPQIYFIQMVKALSYDYV